MTLCKLCCFVTKFVALNTVPCLDHYIMQAILQSTDEHVLVNTCTSSSVVPPSPRLSATNSTPDQAVVSLQCTDNKLIRDNQHRSLSFQSQISHIRSIQDAEDCSSSEGRCRSNFVRSDSSVSTTPTSPEVEIPHTGHAIFEKETPSRPSILESLPISSTESSCHSLAANDAR